MASGLNGPSKVELGITLMNDLNDPKAEVPREHFVLALECLHLLGGARAVAFFCDRLRDLVGAAPT
jgi:hypothetical protein